jgi:hypothetical protein
METATQNSETISLSYDKFWSLVSRQSQWICGLGLQDFEDFDVMDYYPGESATKEEYRDGIRDAAKAAISNAMGFNTLYEDEFDED